MSLTHYSTRNYLFEMSGPHGGVELEKFSSEIEFNTFFWPDIISLKFKLRTIFFSSFFVCSALTKSKSWSTPNESRKKIGKFNFSIWKTFSTFHVIAALCVQAETKHIKKKSREGKKRKEEENFCRFLNLIWHDEFFFLLSHFHFNLLLSHPIQWH